LMPVITQVHIDTRFTALPFNLRDAMMNAVFFSSVERMQT
jgi:hypothetical protein